MTESIVHALFPCRLSAFLIAPHSLVAKNAADLACAHTASKRYGLGLFTTLCPWMDPRWQGHLRMHSFPVAFLLFLLHGIVCVDAKNAADLACARTARSVRYGLGLFMKPCPLMDPRWLSYLCMHSFPVAFLLSLLHGTVSLQRMRRIWLVPARQAKGTGLVCTRHLVPWWTPDDWVNCACTLSLLLFCFPYCTAQCGGSGLCPHGKQKVRTWPVHDTLSLDGP